MKKSLKTGITLAATVLALCGRVAGVRPQLVRAASSAATSKTLDAHHLTPAQTAALVLYYGAHHLPGGNSRDYSAHMAQKGQGAVVKICNKDNVPKGEGPLYKSYPNGASLLYSMQLNTGIKNNGKHIDALYYTIAGNKFYLEDSDAGINADGVTASEMVAYAKKHGGVARILNVAQNTKVKDLRGQSTAKDGLTTQQLGTLVALYAQPDWFKQGVGSGDMYYGTDSKTGFSYVTANGDPTSWVYFKRDGNDVTVKYVHPEGDQSVAETPTTTKHITVSGLKRDYYTNQSQKDEVNGYANQLRPESEYNDGEDD